MSQAQVQIQEADLRFQLETYQLHCRRSIQQWDSDHPCRHKHMHPCTAITDATLGMAQGALTHYDHYYFRAVGAVLNMEPTPSSPHSMNLRVSLHHIPYITNTSCFLTSHLRFNLFFCCPDQDHTFSKKT